MTYTYKIIQYKNKSYSDNNEHLGSVALTDAQHEIKWVKNYNEMLKNYNTLYTIIYKQTIIYLRGLKEHSNITSGDTQQRVLARTTMKSRQI